MRTTFNFDGMGALGIGLGIAGTLFAAWQGKKTSDMARKLDISVKSLAKKTPVQVSQDIVNKAVKTAADKKANEAVTRSINSITSGMKESMSKKITTDVNNTYDSIKENIVNDTMKKVEKWDMQNMRTEVKAMVVDKAFNKLRSASEIARFFRGDYDYDDDDDDSSIDLEQASGILDQFWSSDDKLKALGLIANRIKKR